MVVEMARRFGSPREKHFIIETTEKELDRIRSSQKHDRNHDVTLYVMKDGEVVVIAKHSHPPGLYRAPSGGLRPGEDFLDGMKREMREEIGCEIAVERFLLRTVVLFTANTDSVDWRSFVFLARYVEGNFRFSDHDEIREVRMADWSDFETFGRIMRESDIGGLHYRAALHEAVATLLKQDI